MMNRETPYPAEWTVRRARDAYLAENGFSVESYDAKMTDASFLGIRFGVPNTKRHKMAIKLHDLHHVATGFGTDLVGEGEISAWEARGGLGNLGMYVAGIVLSGTILGAILSPRRALLAYRAAKNTTSLWCDSLDYESLLEMTVGELRARLRVPQNGIATEPRRLHAHAPRESAQVRDRNEARI